MKGGRDYSDRLRDILDAIDKATEFTQGLHNSDFVSDQKTVFAVVRALEIVGEAAKGVPKAVRDKHPELPWRANGRDARSP